MQAPEQLQKEFFAVSGTEKEVVARAAHEVGKECFGRIGRIGKELEEVFIGIALRRKSLFECKPISSENVVYEDVAIDAKHF
jgi:hypothetical protein